jgi:type I restriction enzyme S subunit
MQQARLKNLCDKIGSGATPRGGESVYQSSGTALVRSQNVYNDRFEWRGLAYIGPEHAKELEAVSVKSGDVLLNITGDSVARANRAPPEILPARVNQHVAIVRPRPEVLDSRYLHYTLVSAQMQDYLHGLASCGGTRQALTKGMIEELVIAIPDINTQRALASVLGALDDKIELNRRMSQTLEDLASSLFRSWFVDFDPVVAKAAGRKPAHLRPDIAVLFPDSFQNSELGPIPQGWRVAALSEIAAVNARKRPSTYAHEEIEYLDISSVSEGAISGTTRLALASAPSRAQRLVAHGDTIWSCVRPNRRSFALIQDPPENMVVSTGFATLTPADGGAAYLYAATTTEDFTNYLTGHAEGSAYPAVHPETFENAPMVVPTEEVLREFERNVAPLLAQVAHNTRESRTLAALRDTLLPKLLSGEIRVRDGETLQEETPKRTAP